MLGKIARTIDTLKSYGCQLQNKSVGNIQLTYKDHKINVLPSGSIYIDGNTHAMIPFRSIATMSKFMSKFEKLF